MSGKRETASGTPRSRYPPAGIGAANRKGWTLNANRGLSRLKASGLSGHPLGKGNIGLSKVTLEQLHTASELVDIAAVQNKYNVTNRASEDVLRHCEMAGISFVPYAPLAAGALTTPGALDEIAHDYGATPAQLALAWLLHRSPVMVPIPGTSSSARLRENLTAEQISLTPKP